jgi:hypothetical protein
MLAANVAEARLRYQQCRSLKVEQPRLGRKVADMIERYAGKRNHNRPNDHHKTLSALHLKILQTEQDQSADAARIDDRITSAEKEIIRLEKRQLGFEERQKTIVNIRDSAVLSIRDVRKNMQQRAVKTAEIQNWLEEYLRKCSRFSEDDDEDAHFRARLLELLAHAETSALPDHLLEASQAGHLACVELIRFEFGTREDRHAFMAHFEAITGQIRHHDPVEMHQRLTNICKAIKNADARIADLIARSQMARPVDRPESIAQPGSASPQ